MPTLKYYDATLGDYVNLVGGTSAGGGVTDHGALTGRDAVDSHPTSAVTGLDTELASKATTQYVDAGLATKAAVSDLAAHAASTNPHPSAPYARVFVQSSAPGTPQVGDIWVLP